MKNTGKQLASVLISLAVANGCSCFQTACRGAEPLPSNFAERIRSLEAEDSGLLPVDQVSSFWRSTTVELATSRLKVLNSGGPQWRTNQLVTETRQTVTVLGTEPQLLDFLRSAAASNCCFRIQSFSVRPYPELKCLQASVTLVGHYRLPATGPSTEADAAQAEYLALSQRRHLKWAALDCYLQTQSTLPPGLELSGVGLTEGKRLCLGGRVPVDQVQRLEELRAKLEKVQAHDGKALFLPGSCRPAVPRADPDTNVFSWSLQFELTPPEVGWGDEPKPLSPAERARLVRDEGLGFFPPDQPRSFFRSIQMEMATASLTLRSTSKAGWHTNQSFTDLQQSLNLQGSEPQLLCFLRNAALSNSFLRVQSLDVRHDPDRRSLQAIVRIIGYSRLPVAELSAEAEAAPGERLVLSRRRHLQWAALDCYLQTQSALPASWQLERLNFQDGTRLTVEGVAPADEALLLDEVRAKLEKAQAHDGQALFVPTSGKPPLARDAPDPKKFVWSMQLKLRPTEAP